MHCLVVGRTTPTIGDLSDDELETLACLLGGVLATYETSDFDLFLEMRRADIAFANRTKPIGDLLPVLEELGAGGAEPIMEWTKGLERYWRGYYEKPPVVRFIPEATQAQWKRCELRVSEIEAWDKAFSARVGEARFIEHELVIPHRRTLLEIVQQSGAVSCIDLDLSFEARSGRVGRALLRYVWDSIDGDWFLHRAMSRWEVGLEPAQAHRNLVF